MYNQSINMARVDEILFALLVLWIHNFNEIDQEQKEIFSIYSFV